MDSDDQAIVDAADLLRMGQKPVIKLTRTDAGRMSVSVSVDDLDDFTRSYIETALWSTTDASDDSGGDHLDANYGLGDLSGESVDKMQADCLKFQAYNANALEPFDASTAGHDFWLTRNGHGAGFWDGDYSEPQAAQLTASSKYFGECYIVVGDDGKLHVE